MEDMEDQRVYSRWLIRLCQIAGLESTLPELPHRTVERLCEQHGWCGVLGGEGRGLEVCSDWT